MTKKEVKTQTSPIPTSVASAASSPRFAWFSGDGYCPPFLRRYQGIAFIKSAREFALLRVATLNIF